ncbi:MAG TPA: hypothetical protein VH877_31435 [Polyangia bacterium]|jgi:hypothetical protein|nr:hypothetical protein [Polyangia bacterium]
MSTPEPTTTPPSAADTIDPALGKADLERLMPRILAVPRERAVLPRIDIAAAAIHAVSIGRQVKQPELYARFASLPAREFDIRHVDDLESLARATWYARVEQDTADATSREAKLPVDLVDLATAVKERMLKCAAYYFDGTPLQKEVDDIRSGTGYRDLASDLSRLARLYVDHAAVLSGDTKNYRASDAADAARLAAGSSTSSASPARPRSGAAPTSPPASGCFSSIPMAKSPTPLAGCSGTRAERQGSSPSTPWRAPRP